MDEKHHSPLGQTWEEVQAELFTTEEIAERDFRVDLICTLIDAQRDQHISIEELAKLSGVKKSILKSLVTGDKFPAIDDVLKILMPLGKTLAVVRLESLKEDML
ncbi:MAG: helix-turn-helix domain-containing protein [Eubacteriales bacterium]